MPDLVPTDPGTPIFWETIVKFGPQFAASPWSPEYLETPWPVSFTAVLDHVRRLVGAQGDTQVMPMVALDRYAQEVDLDSTAIQEVIEGVLVHD